MSGAEKSQSEKFRELARQLKCDEDEARFEQKVRVVATAAKKRPAEPEKG